jgi:hypothetical protein
VAAAGREPPFAGGSQPVEQRPGPVPPGRRSPQAGVLVGLVAVLPLAGLVSACAR